MALSAMGVIIAQMSRIQHAVHPHRKHDFKYLVLGVPQASVCQLLATLVIVVAALRFFKHERAIKRGQAHVGGWDLMLIAGVLLAVRTEAIDLQQLELRQSASCCVFLRHLLRGFGRGFWLRHNPTRRSR